MHRSRHAADVAPTGSSFGLRTSTRVPGANLGSDTGSVAVTKRSMFGPPSNHRADPGRFLKKTGALSNKTSQRTFAVAMITGSYPAVAPAIFGVVCSRVCSCVSCVPTASPPPASPPPATPRLPTCDLSRSACPL